MKKIIKIAFCMGVICIHMGIELYPIGKVLALNKLATINFQNTLKAQPFANYVSFLAEEEKDDLVLILEDFVRTKTTK